MKLFYQDRKPDYEEVHKTVSKAYGVEHPERVHGYAGVFLFTLLDVYVSDLLEQLLETEPGLSSQLTKIIEKFIKGDYGESSSEEIMSNIESRYLGFTSGYMFARYKTDYGMIFYESFFDMSLLYIDSEDVTALRKLQDEKAAASWRLPGEEEMD